MLCNCCVSYLLSAPSARAKRAAADVIATPSDHLPPARRQSQSPSPMRPRRSAGRRAPAWRYTSHASRFFPRVGPASSPLWSAGRRAGCRGYCGSPSRNWRGSRRRSRHIPRFGSPGIVSSVIPPCGLRPDAGSGTCGPPRRRRVPGLIFHPPIPIDLVPFCW